jgi:hypothetical protein
MDRRRFFEMLAGAAVAVHELDVEKLLWIPGKLISIPPPRSSITVAELSERLDDPRMRELIDLLTVPNDILNASIWLPLWDGDTWQRLSMRKAAIRVP